MKVKHTYMTTTMTFGKSSLGPCDSFWWCWAKAEFYHHCQEYENKRKKKPGNTFGALLNDVFQDAEVHTRTYAEI
jgi:hypothetical protein